MKKAALILGLIAVAGVIAWVASAPPSYYEPAPPRTIGEVPPELAQADKGDVIARLDYNQYDRNPGLYRLSLKSGEFTELVTRMPTPRASLDRLDHQHSLGSSYWCRRWRSIVAK